MSKYKKWVWLFAVMLLLTAILGQVAHSSGTVSYADAGPVVAAASSIGGNNTAFLSTSGYVYVNGSNAYGLRGDNTTTTPSTDAGKKTFAKVTTNGSTALSGIDMIQACAGIVMYAWDEDSSKLYSWGYNVGAKCGISSETGTSVNVAKEVDFLGANITFNGSKAQQIAAVGGTVVLIDASGDVWSWGQMSTQNATPASRVVDFRLGRNAGTPNTTDNTDTLANDSDSDGIVTSDNAYCSIIPAKIGLTFDTGEKAIAVAGGDSKTFYILTNLGKLYAWGGTTLSPSGEFREIVHPTGGTRLFVKMSASNGATLGLIDNYGLVWVANVASVSVASTETPEQPDEIYDETTGNPTAAAADFYKISVGGAVGSAIFHVIDGCRQVYTWGNNSNGLAGLGTLPPSPSSYTTATLVNNLNSAEDFSTFSNNGVMIKSNTLYTWGDNTTGQLGNSVAVGTDSGTPTACSSTYLPTEVTSYTTPTASPTVTAKPNPNAYDFMVNDNNVLVPAFVGFGAQYNGTLYADITEHEYGINSSNVGTLEGYLDDLALHTTRIFYDPDYEDVKWYDSSDTSKGSTIIDHELASFREVVHLANDQGISINLTYWHTMSYNNLIGKCKIFADEIYYLRKTLGYTNIKYITLENEPNGGEYYDKDLYETVYRAFDSFMKDLGIRDEVEVIAGDLLSGSETAWLDRISGYMMGIVDGYSEHVYWDWWDWTYAENRLSSFTNTIAGYDFYKQKQKHVTEFGSRGYDRTGYVNPGASVATGTPVYAMHDYIKAAYQNARFMMQAANMGYTNLVRWDAYRAKYDSGVQDWSMIGHGTDSFDKRPTYYLMWLFTHAVPPGQKVVAAEKYDAANTKEHCLVFRDPADGHRVIFLANSDTSARAIYVGGLNPSTTFNLYRWNYGGTGAITSAGTIASNADGRIGVNLNADSVAVVTLDTISGW